MVAHTPMMADQIPEKEDEIMKLRRVDYRSKVKDGKQYFATEYLIEDSGEIKSLYEINEYLTIYPDGYDYTRICVNHNREHEFLPDIYFYDGEYGEDKKEFKIQTTAYGALSVEDTKKVIEGYEIALKVVELLTKKFC